jgi:regulator of sirC expression with transglutaminase-like and TPR domain
VNATILAEARAALDAVGQLPDSEIEIGVAALQLARIDAPEANWQAGRGFLSSLAQQAMQAALANSAADAGDGEQRRLVLAGLVHHRLGFRGDSQSYDDLSNANLLHVIERRRGLPVALGLLWLHAADALGWEAYGIDFPGHFLLALRGDAGPVVIDVFDGGTRLEAREMRALVKRVEGEKAELKPGMLTAMTNRAVLLRLQNNIKLRRLRAGDMQAALTCTEDMLRFSPEHAGLWREAGLMNQRLERIGAAIAALERAVALAPADPASIRLRELIDELRNRLN